MSYQVLARKWRPKTFEALVGQEHVVKALKHALDSGRLHHAYLLTGTRGVGKTTIARILAKSLNCEIAVSASPCGVCTTCREIEAGRFVDLLEVDAATNTRVEEMRQLLENAVYAPTRGRFKVYVIDEVHMLSTSAFNAMLKTLEEPPGHVKFILATTDPQKIPVTVLSRCLQFSLKQVPQGSISAHLGKILEAEGIAYDDSAVETLARSAGGSVRDALSLLDQGISHGGGEIRLKSVEQMLGVVDAGSTFALLEQAVNGDADAALANVAAMAAGNFSFDYALQEMASILVRVQIAQLRAAGAEDDGRTGESVGALASLLPPDMVQLAYQIVVHGREEIRFAPDPECGFTMIVLRLCAFTSGWSARGRMVSRKSEETVGDDAGGRLRSSRVRVNDGTDVGKELESGRGARKHSWTVDNAETPPEAGEKNSADMRDWANLVGSLGLSGMARELAQHCELEAKTGSSIRLRLSPTHKHLQVPAAEERLRKALSAATGRSIDLRIELAAIQGETIAARGERAKAELQERAIQAIESDGFVRQVVEVFDAKIIETSIKPLMQEGK